MIPTSSQNSNASNWNTVNNALRQLEREQTTKTFRQAGGNSIVEGRLPFAAGYGTLIYDSDNIARILIGTDPNGSMGIWVSKSGIDVVEELSS